MVANSDGTYHTIGSTVEFGKLVDGESPSTKVELMQKFLNWFDGLITDESEIYAPTENEILSVYPNPFNDNTCISINMENQSNVSIGIFNMNGEKVTSLIKNEWVTGKYTFNWNGCDQNGNKLTPGIYYCVANYGDRCKTIKMVLFE
jgi:hypothetical protein